MEGSDEMFDGMKEMRQNTFQIALPKMMIFLKKKKKIPLLFAICPAKLPNVSYLSRILKKERKEKWDIFESTLH